MLYAIKSPDGGKNIKNEIIINSKSEITIQNTKHRGTNTVYRMLTMLTHNIDKYDVIRGCVHAVLQPTTGEEPAEQETLTSSGHVTSSVTSPIDSAHPLSYRLTTAYLP